MLHHALMKFGIGNWKTIIAEKVLPGKTIAQLVCQTQRLLGQQSLKGEWDRSPSASPLRSRRPLAEFNLLRIDPKKVFDRNKGRTGPEYLRKNGILINAGGAAPLPCPRALPAHTPSPVVQTTPMLRSWRRS